MQATDTDYQLIEDDATLRSFYETNKNIDWLAFDTEFVGEKRYHTRLCLIQITSEHGAYLIDPFRVEDLQPFLRLIEDAHITKITHAGDNDYRLLYTAYGTIPKNIFDTQVAAGFVGYRYPISFQNLVEGELDIRLKKGYAVADWETRPFQTRQLTYALNDVLPLYDLWQALRSRLEKAGRLHWAEEEFEHWEQEAYYERDPHHEVLNSNLVKSLKHKERLFLLRLLAWRRAQAEKKNYSKEMILPGKMISHIVRSVASGKDALKKNRRIPDRITDRHGGQFMDMYRREITAEEQEVLKRLPHRGDSDRNNGDNIIRDLLYLLFQHKAQSEGVSPALIMPKNMLDKMKAEPELRSLITGPGWRRELLGDTFANWINNIDRLGLDIEGGKINLNVKDSA